jgi:hypothetical protein
VNLTEFYYRGHVSRSQVPFTIRHDGYTTRAYAYSSIENAGRVVRWSHGGRTYVAKFVAREKVKSKTVKEAILEVLRGSDIALFPDEIWREVRKVLGKKVDARTVKNDLAKLYRRGKVSRLDKSRG